VERTEDVLKVGDEVEVMVLSADKVRRRISLSLRQLHGGGPSTDGAPYEAPSYDFPEDDEDDEDSEPAPAPALAPEAATNGVVQIVAPAETTADEEPAAAVGDEEKREP
jgi:transcriptional accessory protein Tex/SPT6